MMSALFIFFVYRPGCYGFTVGEYNDKLPVFFPPGYSDFEKLPTDWNAFAPRPEEPTSWVITLTG